MGVYVYVCVYMGVLYVVCIYTCVCSNIVSHFIEVFTFSYYATTFPDGRLP